MNIDEIIAKALEEEFEEGVEQCCADTKNTTFRLRTDYGNTKPSEISAGIDTIIGGRFVKQGTS